MTTLTTQDLVAQLRWRYAVKKFDPARKIPGDQWNDLEQALVLTPSSYGLQPWRFVVVTDAETRAKLRPASWNQSQVTDCSHYVVFACRGKFGAADIDRYVKRIAEVRGVAAESLARYRDAMVRDLVEGPRSKAIDEWVALQTYIALGNFMTAAAVAGIDTCPMEGIEPLKYDEILGLPAEGCRTAVACAAGYRAADDKYAAAPKVRYPVDDVIRRV